jgi:hypothetical protein
MVVIKKFIFQYTRGDDILDVTIKQKDYGDMALYDILFDVFLLTISQDGKVLLSNRESAGKGPVYLDNEGIHKIVDFIDVLKV